MNEHVVAVYNNGVATPIAYYTGATEEQAKQTASGYVKQLNGQGYNNLSFGYFKLSSKGSVPPAVTISWS